MTLLDANGVPLDQMERAISEMQRRLNESLFGGGAEARVRELRRSVLGEDADPEPQIVGLAASLP